MDVHIHQLYMQFLSGQDAGSGPAPFFQPTPPPPKAPMMAVCQWAVALPPQPMQMDASGLAPGAGTGTLAAAGDAFLGDDQLVDGLEEDTLALMRMTGDELSAFLSDGPGVDPLCVPPEFPMRSLPAYEPPVDESPPAPPAGGLSQSSSGSPGLGCAQARATDSPANCVEELLMRMSQSSSASPGLAYAQARATDSPASGVEELLVRMSQTSSGSPGLGCAQARATDSPASGVVEPLTRMNQTSSGLPALGCAQARATDSPASGVVEPLTRMNQTSSGSPALGCAQARATDSPASSVVEPLTRMSGDGQSAFLSDGAAGNSLCVPPECLMNSLLAYQPAMDDSPPVPPADGPTQSASRSPGLGYGQARATDSPVEGAYPPAPPAASLDGTQQVPDDETAEVARMIRVAVRCGDRPSTAWSVEEDQLLRQDLSRFAGQDNVNRCFRIASRLPEKTALDVAYRIRWLTDLEKKKAAKELQLGQEKSAGGNVTKGKGTKVANKKNNKHPLSKEALDSRSVKDIIRDNNRLMDKIEEILRTGEVNNCPDYFYYVKMNMDAMQNKVKDLGSVMEGLAVGDEEWEDVLKDRRDAPQAGDDAATPAP